MNVTTEEREELNTLSLDVFGATSRWQTIIKKGYNHPVKQLNKKSTQFTKVYHTVESVKALMLDLKKKRNEHLAELKKAQEKQQEVNNMLKTAQGSAV